MKTGTNMSTKPTKKDQDLLIRWLLTGKTGLSSRYLASVAFGYEGVEKAWPHDPDDLNRCFELIHAVPYVGRNLHRVAAKTPQWSRLVENWDLLQKTFESEVGRNWSRFNSATKTYELMKGLKV